MTFSAMRLPICKFMNQLDPPPQPLSLSLSSFTFLLTFINSHAFNLNTVIPYHSLSDEDRQKYWDDGLHLKAAGYDWMGDHIADGLIPLLKADLDTAAVAAVSSSPKRRSTVADDIVFLEEEEGTAKDIRQGYVVVRRKDLE